MKASNLYSPTNQIEFGNYLGQNFAFGMNNSMAPKINPQCFGSMFVMVPIFQGFVPQRITFL